VRNDDVKQHPDLVPYEELQNLRRSTIESP